MTGPIVGQSMSPEIRFEGFTDAWEQRKLEDIADRYDNLRIPVAANLRIAGSTPYYGANGIQDYVDGYTHEGEFVLVAEDGANDLKNYPVKCVKGRIWVNNHAHVLQGKRDIADNLFLSFSLNQADIESLLVGGGRAKLNAETMMGIEMSLPKIEEQRQIGAYFAQLDDLITLHQRKCEELQKVKQSCLEKMFPKEGCDVPEIRVEGFSDAWEQRKFADMATRNSGMAVCSSNIPSVEYEDIVSGQGILNKDIREKSNIRSGIRFEPGDVLFGKLRPYLKNWILPNFSGVAVGDFWVLHPFETDSRYLYYLIQTPAFQTAANQSTGTKMPRSDWNLVSKAIFFSPKDITEQRKIGATLQSIDHLITLHQREYDKLVAIKKSMLSKMMGGAC